MPTVVRFLSTFFYVFMARISRTLADTCLNTVSVARQEPSVAPIVLDLIGWWLADMLTQNGKKAMKTMPPAVATKDAAKKTAKKAAAKPSPSKKAAMKRSPGNRRLRA